MKSKDGILCVVGVLFLTTGAYLVARGHGPMHDAVIGQGCRTPVRILEPATAAGGRAAIVFHGLAANARIMQTLGQALAGAGWRVYVMDLPGHGKSNQPYSFDRAEECARFALEALLEAHQVVPDKTILVGHSMGGAVAVRLADRFPAAATVAISPAPMVLPHRMPSNLLILSARFDLPALKATAGMLLEAGGGERAQPHDFAEHRAIKLARVPAASHTSLIFDPRVWRLMVEWADRAAPSMSPLMGWATPLRALAGAWLGLLGLIFLFPVTATKVCTALGCRAASENAGATAQTQSRWPSWGRALLFWAVASQLAVSILAFGEPVSVARTVAGDYLASFLLVAGQALAALLWNETRRLWDFSFRPLLMACLLGGFAMLAFGAWLDWQLTNAWLIPARWWRFFLLLPPCLPYFLAEEAALGPPSGARAPGRFGLFLMLRGVLWLAQVFAIRVLWTGNILLLLLSLYLLSFSVLQRLAADAIRRRSGSGTAAAMFDTILAAWFIAAVFPLR